MARMGEGYWINPDNGKIIEVVRHELSLSNDSDLKKLELDDDVFNLFSPLGDNHINFKRDNSYVNKIRLAGMIMGLIRVRIYQDHIGIQFYVNEKYEDFGNVEFIETINTLKESGVEEPKQSNTSIMINAAKEAIIKIGTKKFIMNRFIIENLGKGNERAIVKSNTFFDSKPVEIVKLMRQNFSESMEEEATEKFNREPIDMLFEDNAFKLGKQLNNINESQKSLSRAFNHMTNPGVFGIITAYRGDYENEPDKKGRLNPQRQKELINRMLSLGFGAFKLYGAWDEGGGVGREESILWFPKDKNTDGIEEGKDIKDLTMAWAKEFEQDGAIYRDIPDPKAPVMLFRHKETDWNTGKTNIINDHIKVGKGYKLSDDISQNEGKLYMNKLKSDLGAAWSELRDKRGKNFVFEELIDLGEKENETDR